MSIWVYIENNYRQVIQPLFSKLMHENSLHRSCPCTHTVHSSNRCVLMTGSCLQACKSTTLMCKDIAWVSHPMGHLPDCKDIAWVSHPMDTFLIEHTHACSKPQYVWLGNVYLNFLIECVQTFALTCNSSNHAH